MSYRVHVIGTLGSSLDEFRSVLSSAGCEPGEETCQRFRFGSSGNWQWANASVWHVDGMAIDQALSTLSTLAIRVTSSDGILWTLTLTGGGKETFRGVHHFTQVGHVDEADADQDEEAEPVDEDFPEGELEEVAGIDKFDPALEFLWDEEEEARLVKEFEAEQAEANEVLAEYTDYGVVLPDSVVAEIKQQPPSRGYRTAFLAHSEQIVAAITQAGIPHDRNALLELLTIGPLASAEQDSELGNMRRFLESLGIEGVFIDAPESADVEDNDGGEPVEASPESTEVSTGELFDKVKAHLSTPMTEITNGPIVLSFLEVIRLHLLATFCGGEDDDQPIAVSLAFPDPEQTPDDVWKAVSRNLEIRQPDSTWELCLEPGGGWWYCDEEQSDHDNHELARCLQSIPSGAHVELTFVVDGPSGACHRYSGMVLNDKFEIQRSFPALSDQQLRRALSLFQLIIGKQPIDLLNETEEAAVRRNYERSQGERPRIRNGKINPQYGSRKVVVQTLFFERFRDTGPWDIVSAEKRWEADWAFYDSVVNPPDEDDEDEEEPTGISAKIIEQYESHQESIVVPHNKKPLYKGKSGKFYQASMSDLKHISRATLAQEDDALAKLGFSHVHDGACDADQRQTISRCYSQPDAVAIHSHRQEGNAGAMVHEANSSTLIDLSAGIREFQTHFKDGSTLVTNNVPASNSKPDRKIFCRYYEDRTWDELWTKHLDGIQRIQTHRQTSPIDHSSCSTPKRFVKLVDKLFARWLDS